MPVPEQSPGTTEALLDVALPEPKRPGGGRGRDRGRWRSIEPAATAAPGDAYRNESAARGVTPAAEPFDDSADYRLRVQQGPLARGAEPPAIRYRFTTTPAFVNGRYRGAFPRRPSGCPSPPT